MSPDEGTHDSRRDPRISHAFMVRYKPPPKDATQLVSPLRDLSSGGARFFSEYPFQQGEEFEAQLVIPQAIQPVMVKAKVAWVKPFKMNMVEVGITFSAGDMIMQQAIDDAVAHFLKKPGG